MPNIRRLAASGGALALLAILIAPTAAAVAADPIGDAIDGLKKSSVFTSDPQLSKGDAEKLRDEISKVNQPIFIAVIPEVPNYNEAPRAIGSTLGKQGVYGVVSGHHWRAGSNGPYLRTGQAQALATASFNAHNPDREKSITPMLRDFVDRVNTAIRENKRADGNPAARAAATKKESHAKEIVLWILGIIAAIIAGILGWFGFKKRSERLAREREAEQAFQVAKRQADARLSSIADGILKYSSLVGGNAKADALLSDVTSAHTRATAVIANSETADEIQATMPTIVKAEENLEDVAAYVAGRDPEAERAAESKRQAKLQAERDRRAAKKREAEEAERLQRERERAEWEDKVRTTEYVPSQQATATNNNYFGGGYYQGQYYGPGYYQDPFWNYLMFDMMFNHDQHSYDSGDHGHYEERHEDTSSTSDSYGGSSEPGYGDWGSGSTEPQYSGGGGGDWGGSDSGGSYDSGGGSYDSGGGDSGGGGGDW